MVFSSLAPTPSRMDWIVLHVTFDHLLERMGSDRIQSRIEALSESYLSASELAIVLSSHSALIEAGWRIWTRMKMP